MSQNISITNKKAPIKLSKKDIHFTFEVKRVVHINPKDKFAIMKAIILEHDYEEGFLPHEATVKGYLNAPYEKDVFSGVGHLTQHPVFGKSLDLTETPTLVVPKVASEVAKFIQKKVRGVGKKKAEKIVEGLGVEAVSIIVNDFKPLIALGFGEQQARKIQEKLSSHLEFQDLIAFLYSLHMESYYAAPIYDQLKKDCVRKIKTNPYILAPIEKIGFRVADKIAFNLNKNPDSIIRYKQALIYYMDWRMAAFGDLCVPYNQLIQDFISGDFLNNVSLYKDHNEVSRSTTDKLIQELMDEKFLLMDKLSSGDVYYYKPAYHHIEESIIKGLINQTTKMIMPFCQESQIDDFIESYEKNVLKLASRQKEAVYMAIREKLSILTGGPGTGKTQTTNTIVKCIQSISDKAKILLIAPTGKAAKRMSQLTGMPAQTIHRALNMKGFGNDDELTILTADYVFVDESSMIDAYLFSKLLDNLSPYTRLVLVGDYNQLPSVGPGLVLRDLINSGKIPYIELNEIFRQAETSQIVKNAHKIVAGKTTKEKDGVHFDNTKQDSYFIQRLSASKIQEDLIETVRRFMNKGFALSDILILSPMHMGELGVDELNRLIQYHFNPIGDGMIVTTEEGYTFQENDKVIQIVNNKELGVFNGDMGKIESIYTRLDEDGNEETVIEVEFYDKDDTVTYVDIDIEQLRLAYVISIHKSQGSEAPLVIMPLHPNHEMMLDKNLIYTGYTRAKKVSVIIGDIQTFDRCIQIVKTNNRYSLIKEKIMAQLP